MLDSIQEMRGARGDGIWLVHESYNQDRQFSDHVIVVVAVVNPDTSDWAAYWGAYPAAIDPERRAWSCREMGNKLSPEIAEAMFPQVPERYGVTYRR